MTETATTAGREEFLRQVVEASPELDLSKAPFSEVIETTGVPRASAYRWFPGGVNGIYGELHRRTTTATVDSMRTFVKERTDPFLTLREVVVGGWVTALTTTREQALPRMLAASSPDMLLSYLINGAPSGVTGFMTDYTFLNAHIFDADKDATQRAAAYRFALDTSYNAWEMWSEEGFADLAREACTTGFEGYLGSIGALSAADTTRNWRAIPISMPDTEEVSLVRIG